MDNELFSPMEIDALGEMMNISLGSSATAVSNLLDHRVDITTPTVSVVPTKDFVLGNLEPAMGVEIKYVSGLAGSNIMLLRRTDIKTIVDILMGSDTADEEFELNDLTISAVCEVMNQMMGAAATAMSDFLGFPVDISTPEPFELEALEVFKTTHLPPNAEVLVVVKFALKIEDALESEFMNVISVELARELLKGLGLEPDMPAEPEPAPAPAASAGGDHKMSQEEIERMLAGGAAADTSEPAPAASGGSHMMSQEEIEQMLAGGGAQPAQQPAAAASAAQTPVQPTAPVPPPYAPPPGAEGAAPYGAYPQPYYPYPPYPYPDPKVINTQPVPVSELSGIESLGKEQAQNLDLIMEVPLQVTVEIGRTQRKVQEILEFSKGSLVVLDKLAGDQVDLFVNGKCVARGDVVVIDDNFGVRITEIVQKPSLDLTSKR